MQRTCCFGSPVAQASFWLMIVSIAIAVLPVWRSPMISWRWPRPIGVMASMALMPVCIGSRRARRRAPGGAGARGRDLAAAVDRVAQRVDDPAEVTVTDGHREHLAGAADLLALLDPGEVTQDDDADLAHVEVQRQTTHTALELEQLVGHDRGQSLDTGDAVAGLGHRADLLAGDVGA